MEAIELNIQPRERALGSFSVRRVLPYAQRQMIGPFIFFDHMGPVHFAAKQGIQVRPHPHLGLATVTYLFTGELLHRDSLGNEQRIIPGAVNWMTAGSGITHSERSAPTTFLQPHEAHGLQSWVALPKEYEEMAPEFYHYSVNALPRFEYNQVQCVLLAGSAFGYEAPAKIYSPLFYMEIRMPAGSNLSMPMEYQERALYLMEGRLKIGNTLIQAKTMPVFKSKEVIHFEAEVASHVMLLGGDPLSEPRFIDWNFVSSSLERIEQAKQDWKAGRFATIPGDDKEYIPLPD